MVVGVEGGARLRPYGGSKTSCSGLDGRVAHCIESVLQPEDFKTLW